MGKASGGDQTDAESPLLLLSPAMAVHSMSPRGLCKSTRDESVNDIRGEFMSGVRSARLRKGVPLIGEKTGEGGGIAVLLIVAIWSVRMRIHVPLGRGKAGPLPSPLHSSGYLIMEEFSHC